MKASTNYMLSYNKCYYTYYSNLTATMQIGKADTLKVLCGNTYNQVITSKLNDLVASYHRAEKNITGTSDGKSEKALFATLLKNAKTISTK